MERHGEDDAIVVGAGPNGLAAAIMLAQNGCSVRVLEASDRVGGGARSAELTQPDFIHDVCSAIHPMTVASPYLSTLPLDRHGLSWIYSPAALAHPLDDGPPAMPEHSLGATASTLEHDGFRYQRLMEPLVRNAHALMTELGPVHVPRHPLAATRFAWHGLRTAIGLGRNRFTHARAQAIWAGSTASAATTPRVPRCDARSAFANPGHPPARSQTSAATPHLRNHHDPAVTVTPGDERGIAVKRSMFNDSLVTNHPTRRRAG